jgi:ribosomal protein L11 methyltransferase
LLASFLVVSNDLHPITHRPLINLRKTSILVIAFLTESLFEGQSTIAAFEGPGGRWDITVHFAEAPDQASIRDLIGIAAGDDVAQDISFDTIEAKDWVKAALENLVPVPAGRFIVHGQHDRARVAPNKLGIRSGGAGGTGHHGTARLPLAARSCPEGLSSAARARPRHRQRVLAIAAAKACTKILASDIDPSSVRVAENTGSTCQSSVRAIRAAASAPNCEPARSTWCWRTSRQSAAAIGNADGAASGTIGVGYSIGAADASGGFRDCCYRARGLVPVRHLRVKLEQRCAYGLRDLCGGFIAGDHALLFL